MTEDGTSRTEADLVEAAMGEVTAEIPGMKSEGMPPVAIQAAVEGKLVERGVSPETAEILAQSLLMDDTKPGVEPETAIKTIACGAVLLVFGAGIAAAAYLMEGASAYFVIAGGPILGGAALIVKGCYDRSG